MHIQINATLTNKKRVIQLRNYFLVIQTRIKTELLLMIYETQCTNLRHFSRFAQKNGACKLKIWMYIVHINKWANKRRAELSTGVYLIQHENREWKSEKEKTLICTIKSFNLFMYITD